VSERSSETPRPGPDVGGERPRYGGEHHPLSLIDRLGERVERELDVTFDVRDPACIENVMPVVRVALRYFDPVVEGFDNLPRQGPFLVVGNHSGGIFMPDYWAFLSRWVEERGAREALYALGFDFLFSIPGAGPLARRLGTVPASPQVASQLLRRGAAVMVYPGGDDDDYRPWTERHRIDFRGRSGFVRLALRHQVPVVPLVSHGSHDVIIVLARGDAFARRLGLDRLRFSVFPVTLGPAGIAPLQLLTWPLPAKVTTRVCEPMDWSHLGPDAADDPAILRRCYEETLGRMQANLDELVDRVPHPVLTRVGTALGLDRVFRS
jgi:1-acyl-sn-glycerol-3-phosphate acyltransferase